MIKKLILFSILFGLQSVFAFQDCIILNDGKLTDISIENNRVIDVYPIVTIMNEKNMLVVHPLKEGQTRFSVLKNNKDIVMFNVKINENETFIEGVKGFEILAIDVPEEGDEEFDFELDKPPI